jgi:hypothetical protein
LQLTDKRICECEEQRNTHTNHRDGVEQADCQEEFTLQHRRQFRLTSRAFQQATAQDPNTDTNAECRNCLLKVKKHPKNSADQ